MDWKQLLSDIFGSVQKLMTSANSATPTVRRFDGSRNGMEPVSFITTESGHDLIVAFALPGSTPHDIKTLSLVRTPAAKDYLTDDECGVLVSYDGLPEDADDLLTAIEVQGPVIHVITQHNRYAVNVSGIGKVSLEEAIRVLKLMNFDGCFNMRQPETES